MLRQQQKFLLSLAVSVFWLSPLAVSAEGELYESLNSAERAAVDRALQSEGLVLEEEPEGKRFGTVRVVSLEVFQEDTGFLTWLNTFHAVTRDWVIEDELLWVEGEPFDGELVSETLRNLRSRQTLSVVAMVPVQSGEPGVVDILSVTRDTWSLRLSTMLQLTDGVIDSLFIALTERNIGGYQKSVALTGLYEQDTIQLGPTFLDPRLFRSRLLLADDFSVVVNHDTGELEGTVNMLRFALPLYSLDRRWGFELLEEHDISVNRLFLGSELRSYDNPDTEGVVEEVPFEIEQRKIDVLAVALLGLGRVDRHVFSLGYGLSDRQYELTEEVVDQSARQAFERDILPISEFSSFLSFSYRFYKAEYVTLHNYQTFAFAEDFRVGHDLFFSARTGSELLGSDTDFVSSRIGVGYSYELHGAVLESLAEVSGRWNSGADELIDKEVAGMVRLASPIWGVFRLHLGGSAILRFDRVTGSLQTLGGDNGLRGFPSSYLLGESAFICSDTQIQNRKGRLCVLFTRSTISAMHGKAR